jgi:sulfate/thiosulfate transport system ATP-binding protein
MSIEVRNVNKTFGTFKALDNISLNFPDGELVALLGPSGCGKTTLLRVIAGLEHADSGQVILDGVDATDKDVRQRRVGFVFQHYALFRHMTVFENIAFGLRVRPRRERPSEKDIRAKVTRLLDLVQLGWVANRFPSQLSGGQRQRIALARALYRDPFLVVLDEPNSNLDAAGEAALTSAILGVRARGGIAVVVAHQPSALAGVDFLLVMSQGRQRAFGPKTEILRELQRATTPPPAVQPTPMKVGEVAVVASLQPAPARTSLAG